MDLSQISQRISNSITEELNYSEDQKEMVTYGLESAFLTLIGFISILAVAFLFDALFPATIAAISGGFLRKLSGGAHFDTPSKCLAFGAIVYSLIGLIANKIIFFNLYSHMIFILGLVLSLIIVSVYAPVDCEAKPIHSRSFRQKLKAASITFVLLSLMTIIISDNYLVNTSAVLGISYQTITLLPVFNNKKKEEIL